MSTPAFMPDVTTLLPLRVVKTDNAIEDTAGSSFAFNDRNSGGPYENTLFVLALKWAVSGSCTLNSVSIGGAAASIIGQTNGTNTGVGLAWRVVPSGSDLDIAWTFTGTTPTRSGFGIFRLDNHLVAAPADFANPAGGDNDTRSLNVDIPAGGGAVAIAGNGSNQLMAWTGAAESYVDLFGNNGRQAGAIRMSEVKLSNHTIQVTNCREVMAASWR